MRGRSSGSPWYLFEIRVSEILSYLEKKTGRAYVAWPAGIPGVNSWHLALREGLRSHLHLDVGIPGLDSPREPIVENGAALHAAVLLRIPVIKVILSGEWEVAVREGLISRAQLLEHQRAVEANLPG
ncbi:MAG: hypothetical protein ACO3ZW_00310 [Opitutales bacterium]|jgi:hypothetical protein